MTNRRIRLRERVKGIAFTCIGEYGTVIDILNHGSGKIQPFYVVDFDNRDELVIKTRPGLGIVKG